MKKPTTLFQTHSCCCFNGKTITANILCLYIDEKQQNESKPTRSCTWWSSKPQQQWLIFNFKTCKNTDSRKFNTPTEMDPFSDPILAVLRLGAFTVVVVEKLHVLACWLTPASPQIRPLKSCLIFKTLFGSSGLSPEQASSGPSRWTPAQSKWHWPTSLHPLSSYLQTVLISKPRCCNYRDSYEFLKRPTVAPCGARTLEQWRSLKSTDTFWH